MRYLEKLVLINSANVPYAELRLDGNVHFTGTQGVGKSTLLRAILFFYNGDKLRLGIPKEKKGFDDFYLPFSNSYIVYQVAHEYGPFCVLVFRSQGRACFRFIDAPFERSWLVDDLTGDVTSEYAVIRQRLEGRYMSRIVDRYDEYRNIIYGNRGAVDKEFGKFALMESPRYQNIPRSLQNVFMNSRVDAEFIRDIIVRSMGDEEPSMDLGYYRRQVAEFAREYHDINIWFMPDSPVRSQAEAALKQYRGLLYQRERIASLYAELLCAMRISRGRLPELERQVQKQTAEIQRFERLASEEKQKFDRENAELNKTIGALEERLRETKRKRRHYEQLCMDEILSRVESEPMVRSTLEQQTRTRDLLTREFQNVSLKYELIENAQNADFVAFESATKELVAGVREEAFIAMERSAKQNEQSRVALEEEYAHALESFLERLDEQKVAERELDREQLRLNYFHPMAEQIDSERQTLSSLTQEAAELESERQRLELQMDMKRREYESQKVDIERSRDDALQACERQEAALKAEMVNIDALLLSASGSLYEWLDARRPGWEGTFGKLFDESKVLYNKHLNPMVTDAAPDTVFGLRLDLSALSCSIRPPATLRAERQALVGKLDALVKRQGEIEKECETQLESLSARLSPDMKELREARSLCEAKLLSMPDRVRASEVKVKYFQNKEKEMTDARKSELERRRAYLAAQVAELEAGRKRLLEEKERRVKALQKELAETRQELATKRDARIGELMQSMDARRSELDAAMAEIRSRRDSELKGSGADVEALGECEKRISELRAELSFIEGNRQLCLEYRIDARELFNREHEFRDQRAAAESRRSQLEEKYLLRARRLEDGLAASVAGLDALKVERKGIEDGIQRAEAFQLSSMFPDYLASVTERDTHSPALQLVEDLKAAVFERSELMNGFKQAVNVFKGNFGAGNIFRFKTELSTDEDYLEYASSLEEFVSHDKIEEYRGRTSDRYLEILTRVSRELGEILRHSSELERTIRAINGDFCEKNFVGAIRSIEIRRTDSGSPLVQLLLRIKEFSDEHQFHLGGINLFSDAQENAAVNKAALRLLQDLALCLNDPSAASTLTLSDTFQLQFRVVENDNDTGWVEKIANVGSDGTDVLVKAMVNIMLVNVFKEKVAQRFGNFRIHCMMDEIGKLHPSNVKGILDFANSRNIMLVASSPTTYNVLDYRYTYLLSKDEASKTVVLPLISKRTLRNDEER